MNDANRQNRHCARLAGVIVSAKIHAKALEDLAAERAKREVLSLSAQSLQAHVDWLCLLVNQLEQERAILYRKITHLEIPVPSFAQHSNALPALTEHVRDLWASLDDGSVTD